MTIRHFFVRPDDEQRMCRIMLAILDGDIDRANTVLTEANNENTVHLLIAAFAVGLGNAMCAPPMTDDQRRSTFERTILAVQEAGEAGA